MEDVCLMYFNFNLFLAPTTGGLQWDQFLECGKSGLRQHERIAWDATPSWHHQDHHFVPRTAAAGIGSGFRAENWSWKLLRQLYNNASNHVYILHTLHIILTYMDLWNHWRMIPKHRCFVPQKNSKIFFLPKAAKKNVYVPFPPLAPEIDCRHGNSVGGHWRIWEAEMIKNGDTSLFTYCTFSWEKPWCLSNGCYY